MLGISGDEKVYIPSIPVDSVHDGTTTSKWGKGISHVQESS
jgi:hypothetical protein